MGEVAHEVHRARALAHQRGKNSVLAAVSSRAETSARTLARSAGSMACRPASQREIVD